VLLVAAAGFAIAEVLLVVVICNLMFSLIAYAIGDLLDFVLDLQILCRLLVMLALLGLVLLLAPVCLFCWFWLVGLGFLAGSGWFVCAYQANQVNSTVGTLWNLVR
jgi:hypothetical protein